jgi:hypothetical protein
VEHTDEGRRLLNCKKKCVERAFTITNMPYWRVGVRSVRCQLNAQEVEI